MSIVILPAALVVVVAAVVLFTRNRVQYVERVEVEAPAPKVFEAVASQEALMRWSAWPAATQSQCRVVGADRAVGATIEFLKDGRVTGSQKVTRLVEGSRVEIELADPSPFGQRPLVHFQVNPLAGDRTEVLLEFDNTIRRPFHLLVRFAGIAKWVRGLHRKDLAGLKRFVES